jgi:D-amino-acid oxidase
MTPPSCTRTVPPIAIIGGGVIGLTSAVRLLEQGYAVTIFAREISPHTTSDVAAAYWAPHDYGEARRKRWAMESLAVFTRLAHEPSSGVDFIDLYELFDADHGILPDMGVPYAKTAEERFSPPWWSVRFYVPRIDTPLYMPWLLQRFRTLGGEVRQQAVSDLRELSRHYPIMINCAGLGARSLTGDAGAYPIRGQVLLVRKPPGLPECILSASSQVIFGDSSTYIVPRSQDCLLGGTFQTHDDNLQINEEIATGILQRCTFFYPELQQAEILAQRVGLRPGRRTVRLEPEWLGDKRLVIHNYGHGPFGHTLAWGCAGEVVKLAEDFYL